MHYTTDKTQRYLTLGAQALSKIFAPSLLPLIGFVLLLTFSYLNMLPNTYKAIMLLLVGLFTVVIPRRSVKAYRNICERSTRVADLRERRVVPYVLSISSYSVLLYIMHLMHMPTFTLAVITACVVIQVVCAIFNTWIHVSTHAAGMGGLVSMIMAFSLVFSFNPIMWLCIGIILCGLVCSARIVLERHTLGEVGLGVVIGLACGWCAVAFI